PKIYQLAKVFRNAEGARWHSPEFTMLEWYSAGMDYEEMMRETMDLLRHVVKGKLGGTCDVHAAWEKVTVVDALKQYADVDISGHLDDLDYLRGQAGRIGGHVSEHDDWPGALLKILMAKVEPRLGFATPAILYDYPLSMA